MRNGNGYFIWIDIIIIIVIILLLKKGGNARLAESDLHPVSPRTPAPQLPTRRKKEEKKKRVEDKKGASSLGQK